MNAYLYVEGGATGADSKYLKIRCQEGFHKLLAKMGFDGRQPRLVACGGRGAVYDRFCTAHAGGAEAFIAMWIDSEEPMTNIEAAWEHLQTVTTVRSWPRPDGARDDQVLFMTTCMESWIAADRDTLKDHYGKKLQENALPALENLENRDRHEVQDKLAQATRNCLNAYEKGKRSFIILGRLNPAALEGHLPSFARVRRILNQKLR